MDASIAIAWMSGLGLPKGAASEARRRCEVGERACGPTCCGRGTVCCPSDPGGHACRVSCEGWGWKPADGALWGTGVHKLKAEDPESASRARLVIAADADALETIVFSFLSNALKYTPVGRPAPWSRTCGDVYLAQHEGVGTPDRDERGPVVGVRVVAPHGKRGIAQRLVDGLASRGALVEAGHEATRRGVVHLPEARHQALRARE